MERFTQRPEAEAHKRGFGSAKQSSVGVSRSTLNILSLWQQAAHPSLWTQTSGSEFGAQGRS